MACEQWHDDDDDDDTTDHETYSTPRVFYGGSAVCDILARHYFPVTVQIFHFGLLLIP